ncbi:MAG: hypothetical protein IIB65_08690 [Proteobacteria bacterium]|nr:hypothetical protein [Pseudomonadota bacterium]MCH8096934.1 hypothetical protein [Pseudomonadota bacterium]
MRLKIRKLMDGPGPNEALVAVNSASGAIEQVVVHRTAIEHDMIDVGHPIHQTEDKALVELPREAMSGSWRVWVPNEDVDS